MTPKVLVISNECFSKTSSNGRTLGNFFLGWPKECLAQFYLTGKPDAYYCDRYFQVSDRHALNALIGRGSIGGIISLETATSAPVPLQERGKKISRNALTMLGRNAVWNSGAWQKSGYWNWVKEIQPDIIFTQVGDSAFILNLAVETAKRANAKLLIFNGECYYYKNFDYFQGTGLAHIAYPLFHKQLKKAFEKAYAIVDYVIYSCDELKEQYAQDFSVHSETLFTSSDIQCSDTAKNNHRFTTVYCGNLGLKRHESLMDIAEVLQSISADLYVDVYGKAPNDEVAGALNSCKGIRYHGLVPYEQVKKMIQDSDLLLHVESFDAFYREDVKFGFSTKIADNLASGNCFLLYAPEQFACYRYLEENKAAYTASNKQDLDIILRNLIEDSAARVRYREAALDLAERNHRLKTNNQRFQTILRKLVD